MTDMTKLPNPATWLVPVIGDNSFYQGVKNDRLIAAQKNGRIRKSTGKVTISFYGMIAYKVTTPGGLEILIDPFRNAPDLDLGGIWFLSQFPEIYTDVVISTHAHGDHDGMARVKAPMVLDRLAGTVEIGDARITGFPDKHVSNPQNEIYDGIILEKAFGKHNYPPGENMEWDNSIILIETEDFRIVHWGDNRQNPPREIFDQLHDIDIFLSAVSDDGHITTPRWGEKIGKEIMNAKVVFPGHYNVEGINHPWASGIIDAAQFTRMHDHTFIRERSVSLSKEEIKDYNFHVMYFGENVDWDVLKWPHKFPYNYPVQPLDVWPGDHREWERYKPKNRSHY
jgi:L-ascorbate metabolism protein UlaG (beta-lactamase superfamily)